MAKPVIRPELISSAQDKERTLTLGEGDKQQVSIASVFAGKLVAQKLGALNYSMVCIVRHTTGPFSFAIFALLVGSPPFTSASV